MGGRIPAASSWWAGRNVRSWLLIGTLLFAWNVPTLQTEGQSPVESVYAETTGHILSGPFLTYWLDVDGEVDLGLPVTEALTIENHRRQYFEFGVLTEPLRQDITPAFLATNQPPADTETGNPERIERLAVGSVLRSENHDPTHLAQERRVGASRAITPGDDVNTAAPSDGLDIPITFAWPEPAGERVSEIANVFTELGGADRFGEPIGEPMVARGQIQQWYTHGRISVFTRGEITPRVDPVGWELAIRHGFDIQRVEDDSLPTLEGPTTPVDGLIANAAGPFAPSRLLIPSLGIDAGVEAIGIYGGVMGTPVHAMNVGWYADVSSPGTGSNVVMAGHVGTAAIGPAVFHNLTSAGPGTLFYVIGPDGTGATYRYVTSYVLGANDPADGVLAGYGGDGLTLITCTGTFTGVTYDRRLIVYAERI